MTGPVLMSVKGVPEGRWGRFGVVSRRVGHGGTAWSTDANLLQPQDGAEVEIAAVRGRASDRSVRDRNVRHQATARAAMMEPEDARLTGGTRSLMRRMIGMNMGSLRKLPVRPVILAGVLPVRVA